MGLLYRDKNTTYNLYSSYFCTLLLSTFSTAHHYQCYELERSRILYCRMCHYNLLSSVWHTNLGTNVGDIYDYIHATYFYGLVLWCAIVGQRKVSWTKTAYIYISLKSERNLLDWELVTEINLFKTNETSHFILLGCKIPNMYNMYINDS